MRKLIVLSFNGVIVATYVRAGEVETGSFAPAIPTEAELARRKRLAAEDTVDHQVVRGS
jgi:hypothetical protein